MVSKGRPTLPPHKKRDRIIRFTVTPAESEEIREDARQHDMELSEYIRSVLLKKNT
jgi:hypothetical protein